MLTETKPNATKANATKANATKPLKRTYAEKMLRKYELILLKRHRDKRIHLGRKRKDWTLDI
jgi:hypothetical protein